MNELLEILSLRYRWLFVALLLFISACSPTLPANIPVEVTFEHPAAERVGGVRLEPPEPSWDGYGEAVDVHGDVLVVGAPEWNPCGHGSAYVYRSSSGEWREEAQLTASDRDDVTNQGRRYGLRFGTAVAVGEDVIAVGATGNAFSGEGEYPGAVYLYEYDGRVWTETAKLSPDPLSGEKAPSAMTSAHCTRLRPELFAALVALDGDTLAVGGDARGFVYLYQRGNGGWQEEARIEIPSVPGRETYMAFMSLVQDTLAVSAFYLSPQAAASRSSILTGNAVVYVFERAGNEWQESFRFAPEGEEDVAFYQELNIGASVALSGDSGQADLLAIGLPGFPDWSELGDDSFFFGSDPEQAPAFRHPIARRGQCICLSDYRVAVGSNGSR